MSLKNKYLKIFQMGFSAGVEATAEHWNGETYGLELEDQEHWERLFKSEVQVALAKFIEFMEKERI
jgi:hypothetical protein